MRAASCPAGQIQCTVGTAIAAVSVRLCFKRFFDSAALRLE
jgi:hypothetical protein